MSTPHTVSDDEEPQRLRLRRRRPDSDRGRRRGRAAARHFPDGTLPQPEPVESDLIRAGDSAWLRDRARKHGAAAGSREVYDPWVLGSPDRIPYFAELASLRDRVKYRLTEESARAEEDGALEAGRVRAAATAAGERLARANRRRTGLERQQMVTTAQLDRLARRADRWQTFRDTVRGSFERRWLRNRMPPDWSDGTDPTGPTNNANGSHRPAADRRAAQYRDDEPETARDHARWQAVSEHDPAAEDADGFDRALSTRAAWEGAAARPGMPRWIKIGVLGLLIAVEFPVYYTVFENLHGVGAFANLLSVSLTVAVAVAMILAPHIGGRILRHRSATGAVRLSAVPALALIGVWAYGAWALGDLRAKVAFKEEPPLELPPDVAQEVGDSVSNPPSLIESLHLDPHSVSLMFVALLLLSGGIAFLIGLGEEHPYLAAYRTTAEQLRELERQTEADTAGLERAKEAEATLDTRAGARRTAHEARLYAVDALYEAAAHAYLDGLAGQSADPAVTEAAKTLSQQWPLLPHSEVG
ncbi:hypothetical protein [Streptomyces sp. ME19-01-6]|uniref:hypothetical protein n=1 Tax=Streptomyces sp. ME19-01-6 TaxID=3028686 RepID=UPI0029B330E3|nr:hypothetical protein [Streptomyces sp. ME19-01-6]MDX3228441.1 hypothetical protein [Streptomyces sp. ME19-01-6]